MTQEHIFYIPIIFFLGLLFGSMISEWKNRHSNSKLQSFPHDASSNFKLVPFQTLLFAFLIFLGTFALTHFFDIPLTSKAVSRSLGGLEIFDKQPSFSSDEVYARLNAFNPSGLESYKKFTYTVDIIFPLTFLYFLIILSRFVTQRRRISKLFRRILLWLPVIWFLSDMVENMIIFNLLSEFPTENNFLAGILGYVLAGKFTLMLLSIFSPTLLFVIGKKRAGEKSQDQFMIKNNLEIKSTKFL